MKTTWKLVTAGAALLGASCAVEPGEDLAPALRALEGDELCSGAYGEATEHTCSHVMNGPYASVSASATVETALANVNLPHTAYTVNLVPVDGRYQGAVRYRPSELTTHLVFVAPDVPFVIHDATGVAVAPELTADVDPEACDPDAPQQHLVRYEQFTLDPAQTYRIFFGPTDASSVLFLVEHVEEFAGICEGCEPVDLDASVSYWPLEWEVAHAELDDPVVFELPETLPVVEGNAGQAWSLLSYVDEDSGQPVFCWYRGAASVPVPHTPAQIASGDHYTFHSCSNGLAAGDDVETHELWLKVLLGGNPFPEQRTTVELFLEPECGGHEHEHEEEP